MSSDIKVDVLVGPEAYRWLENEAVREKWKRLYEKCPWGTVFQSQEFVLTWYNAYLSEWTPVVAFSEDDDRELAGLLTLAISKASGALALAGDHHAEYQTWLASPYDENAFIQSTIRELGRQFLRRSLRFLFVPPGTPLEWTVLSGRLRSLCDVRQIPRGLISLGDSSALESSLRKKNSRNSLNRLQREGPVRFEQLLSHDELATVFDEIMTHGDLRLAAAHNVEPTHDPLKKGLYSALMQVPGLVHATILRAGDRMVSAHVGLRNRNQVLLGVFTHSPLFAKQSPGTLHLLMLGVKLAKEGCPVLDLTPGGEYKDRFATHYDDAHILTVFFNRAQYLRYKLTRGVASIGKRLLSIVNVTPELAQEQVAQIQHKLSHLRAPTIPGKVVKLLTERVWSVKEMRLYSYDAGKARDLSPQETMKKDHLPDILAYKPSEGWQPRSCSFLKSAFKRLGSNTHIYTHVEDGRLVHWGWLVERQEISFLPEVDQEIRFPPDSSVLTDYFTHPAARGRGFYRQSLTQMARDAALIPGTRHIFIAVLADNLPSRRVIEDVGFNYEFSLFRRRALGRTTSWTNATPALGGREGELHPWPLGQKG